MRYVAVVSARGGTEPSSPGLSVGERTLDALLEAAGVCSAHQLPALVAEYARRLGAIDATIHLIDLQQVILTPFPGQAAMGSQQHPDALAVDSTLAGRAYQHGVVVVSRPTAGTGAGTRMWLPLCEGADRLGVLCVVVADADDLEDPSAELATWLRRLAAIVGELLAVKSRYGDSIVVSRRSAQISLAAEMQWGLLPPLTFVSQHVSIAAILEPAYEVAGDSVDYSVDPGVAHFGVFDGMGHGLGSAQLAVLAVSAYRNARRSGRSLAATAAEVDRAVAAGFPGEPYTTAVLAELRTSTGHLSWVSAGHPEPLLLRSGQLVRSMHVEPGLPFGLGLPDTEHLYAIGTDQLQPEDQVLFLTDGVLEARSPSGDLFGLERLVDLLARNIADNLSPSESMRRVGRALLEHKEAQLTDDATMLLVEWNGPTTDPG